MHLQSNLRKFVKTANFSEFEVHSDKMYIKNTTKSSFGSFWSLIEKRFTANRKKTRKFGGQICRFSYVSLYVAFEMNGLISLVRSFLIKTKVDRALQWKCPKRMRHSFWIKHSSLAIEWRQWFVTKIDR